jgi:hypothetical protein
VGAFSSTRSTNEPARSPRGWWPHAWVYTVVAGSATHWVTIDAGNIFAIPAAAKVMATARARIRSFRDPRGRGVRVFEWFIWARPTTGSRALACSNGHRRRPHRRVPGG